LLHRPPLSTLFPYTTLFRSLPLLQSHNLLGAKMNSGPSGCLERLRLLCFNRLAFPAAGHALIIVSVRLPLTRPLRNSCRPLKRTDRKSTRLNSSHVAISYAV